MDYILQCNNLTKKFFDLVAVRDLSFSVVRGQITSIIGPNGAGKSTTLDLVTRLVEPSSGSITFEGRDIKSIRPVDLVKQGIARTFQNVRLFQSNELTVLDNVKIGMHSRYKSGFFASGFHLKRALLEEKHMNEEAHQILNFLNIYHLKDNLVSNLSFGNQRLVELARALAAKPKLLILDEPAAGLNDVETENLAVILRQINRQGVSILLVEHHMGLVMEISDKIIVLNFGTKLTEGTPETVKNDQQVIEAYLGKEVKHAAAGND